VAVVREDVLPSFAFGTLHKVEIPALSVLLDLHVDSLTQLPDFATWRSMGGAELRSFEVRLRADKALPGLRPGMVVVFTPR
jgi:HlyD family secretion protein